MKNDLTKEIQESIEKNLPQQIGETLQKRLSDLEKIEEDYANNKKMLGQATEKVDELVGKINELNKLKIEESKIKHERQELEIDKLRFDVSKQIAESQAEEAKKRADMVFGFLSNLTSNNIYKTQFNSAISRHGYYDANGHYVDDRNETITEEKEKEG